MLQQPVQGPNSPGAGDLDEVGQAEGAALVWPVGVGDGVGGGCGGAGGGIGIKGVAPAQLLGCGKKGDGLQAAAGGR